MDIERLGKYEIIKAIGKGAAGTVWRARDPVIDRIVAIKTVRLEHQDAEHAEEVARFKREAQAAGRLSHPNIVAVYDYGEQGDLAYIVMEHVDGGSLKNRLDAGERLPLPQVARVMDELLAALAHAHEKGVVHRDIKPANMMLTQAGQVKVADFGIARIESSTMTQAGTVLGTPAYMSPEQFRGEPVDARTDLYSAGVVLYQLLTGDKPFEGNLTAIMHKVLNVEPPKPSEIAGSVPAAFDSVVRKAMAKRPSERYQSAAAFREAIAAAMKQDEAGDPLLGLLGGSDAEATVVARPAAAPVAPQQPTAAPAGTPAPRSGTPVGLIAGGAGAVVAAGLAAFLLLGRGEEPPAPAPGPSPPAAAVQPAPPPPPVALAPPPRVLPEPAQQAVPVPPAPAPFQAPSQATSPPASPFSTAPAPLVLPPTLSPAPPPASPPSMPPQPPPAAAQAPPRPAVPPPPAPTQGAPQAPAQAAATQATVPIPAPAAPQPAPPPVTAQPLPATPAPEPPRAQPQPPVATAPAPSPAPVTPPPVVTAPPAAPGVPTRPPDPLPAPAPPQQVAAAPAAGALRSAIAGVLSEARCAMIGGDMEGANRARLTGYAQAGGGEAALRLRLASAGVPPGAIDWGVRGFEGPYCPALDLLRPYADAFGAPPSGLGLSLPGGRTRLVLGDLLTVTLAMPGFASYLRVSYFTHDGEVVHLHPTPSDPARTFGPGVRVALGDPASGGPRWEVGPPYGTEMIVAVASERPLFATSRPEFEQSDDYLAALASALRSGAGGRIAARVLMVDVAER